LTYATTDDVAARLGRTLTDDETTLVGVRLNDVERMILLRVPDLADKITANDVDVENVKMVESNVLVRLLKNPDGYISETDGDYTYRFGDKASGELEILAYEWVLLGVQGSGMGWIDVRPRTPFEYPRPDVHPFLYGG
jgi:hypothetical protein